MRIVDAYFHEIQELIGQTKCEILREELVLFFEKHKKGFSRQIDGKHIAFYFLIINLKDVSIKEINWEACVKLHNLVIYEELTADKNMLPKSLKTTIIKVYEKGLSTGLFSYQIFINDFFRELYKHLKHEYINIQDIERYEKYLVSHYFQHDKKRFIDYKNEEILSALKNYPLDGDYAKLTKVSVKNGARNYWINTNSIFIRTWVENYLNDYAMKYVEPVLFRLVGYYFVDSANSYKKQVNGYLDVNNDFLNHQVECFKKIPEEIIKKLLPVNQMRFLINL